MEVKTDLFVTCIGCCELQEINGAGCFKAKPNQHKTARIILGDQMEIMPGVTIPIVTIKCDKCGWHEPLEADDLLTVMMELTNTKSMPELLSWIVLQVSNKTTGGR